jgi:protein required for attachment to host cells/mono/diheme cytochrome c family protein
MNIVECKTCMSAAALALGLAVILSACASDQRQAEQAEARGHATADKWCSECHRVSPDQPSGARAGHILPPPVAAPSFMAVADRQGITPESLRRFVGGLHLPMPTFRLSPDEQGDVIAYIMSLKGQSGARLITGAERSQKEKSEMRHLRVWYVIADGGRARIVEKDEFKAYRTQREVVSSDVHRRSRDIDSDRPGRTQESAGPGSHALDARTDPHKAIKREFAHELAAILNEEGAADGVDRIVLVAPVRILPEIENALDKPVRQKVAAKLQKDLTNVPNPDLDRHFAELRIL